MNASLGQLRTIEWTGTALRLLDQTKLPCEVAYLDLTDEREVFDAIRRLVVRGAPAIGVAAAFGVYLGMAGKRGQDAPATVDQVCDFLAGARPTAVNLFWALDRIRKLHTEDPDRILAECHAMLAEDVASCRAIGEHGLAALRSLNKPEPLRILTHCNAGALATCGIGTALAPLYLGHERGVKFQGYADETRPLLQGARLTAFELSHAGIPVTILCDGMSASLMRDGKVDAVIVGADRIAANGDVANKIGTLPLAIVARHFGVPFYVAAPMSTVDRDCPTGSQIPIEHRDSDEVRYIAGTRVAPDGVDVFNPAFDVTPSELITAIITDKGILPKANPP